MANPAGRKSAVQGALAAFSWLARAASLSVILLGAQAAMAQRSVVATVSAYSGPGAGGPADLVSNAIPFRPGELANAGQVRILSAGSEVPIATRVLARWPQDNSIRSLLVQFAASPGNYTVEIGSSRTTTDREFVPVAWDVPQRIMALPAQYLSESLIFWEQTPLGSSGFPDWDAKQLNGYSRIATPGSSSCVRDDHYYDAITTTFQLYARTGNPTYLINGRRWALHHRRDQIYLTGSDAGHPRCSGNYLNNTRYTFPQGLVQDYFMFGDEQDVAVSRLVVEKFYMSPSYSWWFHKAPGTRGFWTEREPAFALIGILALYEATLEDKYLDFATNAIGQLHAMQVANGNRAWVHNLYDHDPDEGCSQNDWGSSPWMSGLLLEAIVKYHKLTGSNVAKESILMAVDDLRQRYLATREYAGRSFVYLGCSAYKDGTPDLDGLIAHAFGYAYRITGDPSYRDLGIAIFRTSIEAGTVSSHKHFNQQFRSSGHFPAYISQSQAARRPNPPENLRVQ